MKLRELLQLVEDRKLSPEIEIGRPILTGENIGEFKPDPIEILCHVPKCFTFPHGAIVLGKPDDLR